MQYSLINVPITEELVSNCTKTVSSVDLETGEKYIVVRLHLSEGGHVDVRFPNVSGSYVGFSHKISDDFYVSCPIHEIGPMAIIIGYNLIPSDSPQAQTIKQAINSLVSQPLLALIEPNRYYYVGDGKIGGTGVNMAADLFSSGVSTMDLSSKMDYSKFTYNGVDMTEVNKSRAKFSEELRNSKIIDKTTKFDVSVAHYKTVAENGLFFYKSLVKLFTHNIMADKLTYDSVVGGVLTTIRSPLLIKDLVNRLGIVEQPEAFSDETPDTISEMCKIVFGKDINPLIDYALERVRYKVKTEDDYEMGYISTLPLLSKGKLRVDANKLKCGSYIVATTGFENIQNCDIIEKEDILKIVRLLTFCVTLEKEAVSVDLESSNVSLNVSQSRRMLQLIDRRLMVT